MLRPHHRIMAFYCGPRSWNQKNSMHLPTPLPICNGVPWICGGIFDFDTKSERLTALNTELEDPKVWDDVDRAQALGKEKKSLEDVVSALTELDKRLRDEGELFVLARDERDDDTLTAVAG